MVFEFDDEDTFIIRDERIISSESITIPSSSTNYRRRKSRRTSSVSTSFLSDTIEILSTEDGELLILNKDIDEDGDETITADRVNTLSSSPSSRRFQGLASVDDFRQLRVLGKGASGKVILVQHIKTGALFAQKQLKKANIISKTKNVEHTKAERQILESVKCHPFIVKLYYAFQDEERLYLILEYASGGELFTHLAVEKMFSEDMAAFYVAELVSALIHLHSKGIAYRDLKPENCLLDAHGHLLLTDFGLSKVSEEDGANSATFCGTECYMAPEILKGEEYDPKVADWWSLGILIHDLITGQPPFNGKNNKQITDKIVKQKLVLPYYLSPDAKDLITRLLKKAPKSRLGFNPQKDHTFLRKHRFFRKIDWKALENRECQPPIIPFITDPSEAENFPDFRDQSVTNSPVQSLSDKKSLFSGFTYSASPTLFRNMMEQHI